MISVWHLWKYGKIVPGICTIYLKVTVCVDKQINNKDI